MRKFGSEELDRILIRLEEIALHFFGAAARRRGRDRASPRRDEFLEQHQEIYTDLLAAFDLLASHLKLIADAPQEMIPLFRRANELRAALQFLIEGENPSFVHWIERRGRGVFLQATPIDVADVLRAAPLGQSRCGDPDLGDARGGGQVRLRASRGWASRTPARWWCKAISITGRRRCFTFRTICRTRRVRHM